MNLSKLSYLQQLVDEIFLSCPFISCNVAGDLGIALVECDVSVLCLLFPDQLGPYPGAESISKF